MRGCASKDILFPSNATTDFPHLAIRRTAVCATCLLPGVAETTSPAVGAPALDANPGIPLESQTGACPHLLPPETSERVPNTNPEAARGKCPLEHRSRRQLHLARNQPWPWSMFLRLGMACMGSALRFLRTSTCQLWSPAGCACNLRRSWSCKPCCQ